MKIIVKCCKSATNNRTQVRNSGQYGRFLCTNIVSLMNISETRRLKMTDIQRKTFIYTRNSDVDSFDRGSSADTQIDKCKSYADLHNLKIMGVFKEQVSGGVSLLKRKVFSKLFEESGRGSIILFSRLDRMSRSIKDTLDFLEICKSKGIEIHTTDLGHINGEGIGRIVFLIMSVFAETERVMISERVKSTKTRMRKSGRYLGGANTLFGKKLSSDGKTYVDDTQEQSILNRIFELKDKKIGFRNMSKIIENEYDRKLHFSHINKIYNREKDNFVRV